MWLGEQHDNATTTQNLLHTKKINIRTQEFTLEARTCFLIHLFPRRDFDFHSI